MRYAGGISSQLEFISPSDGSRQVADVHSPEMGRSEPLPLVLAPHPIGWSAAEDYFGGIKGFKRGRHLGWRGIAEKHHVIVVQPHGHGRNDALASCAYHGQIADMASLSHGLTRLGLLVDTERIYACGLSMGGLESLVLAGRYPTLLAGVFVFNPVVDLAAWYADLRASKIPAIRRFGTWKRIQAEVGGTPTSDSEAYLQRSATGWADQLTRTPTMIYWSHLDVVVPRQEQEHSLRLYRMVKALDERAPFAEYNHTFSHGPLPPHDDWLAGWRLHEYSDYDLAMTWLLTHRRH